MTGTWSDWSAGGKPADLFEPAGSQPLAGVVVFLGPYDGVSIRTQPAYADALSRHRLACVVPAGAGCWWCDVVAPTYDETSPPLTVLRECIVPDVMRRFSVPSIRVALAGVEMGGQGALQFAYRHSREFPVVAAIGPKVDFETWHGYGTTLDRIFPTAESARQATATLQFHPLNWPRKQLLACDPLDPYCFSGTETLATKLESSGVPFEKDFTTSTGEFGWSYWNRMAEPALAFIARSIDEEARRLPIVGNAVDAELP